MTFEEILLDIESMIGLELNAINPSTPVIRVETIDRQANRYHIKVESSNRIIKRNLKELEVIFRDLKRNGYCNVEQSLEGGATSRNQPETVFANLPYIQHFKFERRKHLVLRNSNQHLIGTSQELPQNEQKNVRDSITEHKKFSQSALATSFAQVLSKLKNEIDLLHEKSPGFLVETEIVNVLEDLEVINSTLQKSNISIDKNDVETIKDKAIELMKGPKYEMSDIVDSSVITGVIDDGHTLTNESEIEGEIESEGVREILVPNIRRQTPSLALLYERLIYNEIELQPDYQRGDRVWNDKRKSKLIESILMGLPLPIFYFGERKNDNWAVIDGLQRLTAIREFMEGSLKLKLDKESPIYDLNGMNFKEFDRDKHRKHTRAIREFEITAYIIEIDDEDSEGDSNRFIIELFHRINTYGVQLSDQEIRSAINFGNSVYYLKFLAASKTFTSATNNTINSNRQKDLEVCLGALAFIIYGYKDFGTIRYDEFLSKAMGWINDQNFEKYINSEGQQDYRSNSPTILSLTLKFESSLNLCKELFGIFAFKKVRNTKKAEPLSKTLFEVLVCIFFNTNEQQKDLIRKNAIAFVDELYDAIKTDSKKYAIWDSLVYQETERGLSYSLSTSTGKKVTINYRFNSILNILQLTTGCKVEVNKLSELKRK
ncbi:MAG: DUF262 domain-containing protein [Colwellia sp.]|nr:DUF262 domain-containing protein [Colwellia sp.]